MINRTVEKKSSRVCPLLQTFITTTMTTTSVAGKVFIITGGASGMGLATATLLLARGAQLGLCDTNEPGLSKVVEGLNNDQKSRVLASVVDITNRPAVASFFQSTKKRFGKINGVANFAGVAGHRLGHEQIWEIEDQEYDFIMDVNVRGAFNILSEALKPGLLEEPGSIVHAASMFAERGFSKGAIYSASKHAGIGMVKSAAIEAGKRGIRVNAILP
jgi:NAD(P)-dependent dehydrogenase (short-subunit alcohol dehydrogenase family)